MAALGERQFRDRLEAGRELGRQLKYRVEAGAHPLVLALPRSGVPVGFEVAQALDADLDVLIVRKLGVPGYEELAMGAIAGGGAQVMNEDLIQQLDISAAAIEQAIIRERGEIERREKLYREGRPPAAIAGRLVILVDDGLATGASMLVAAQAIRGQGPRRIIAGVPVASQEACDDLREAVDELICMQTPAQFRAVGFWYEDFSQTSDAEVQALLRRAAGGRVR